MFSHLRRIAVAMILIVAVAILAIVIDGVVYPVYGMGEQFGVSDGPFAVVYNMAGSIMWWPVAILLVGIIIWVLIGPIQQTRREEQQRRIR